MSLSINLPGWVKTPEPGAPRKSLTIGSPESGVSTTSDISEQGMYVLGRGSPDCPVDVELRSESASRRHVAQLHSTTGDVYAMDLKSAHGTFTECMWLNGVFLEGMQLEPWRPRKLLDGQRLVLGLPKSADVLTVQPRPADRSELFVHGSGTRTVEGTYRWTGDCYTQFNGNGHVLKYYAAAIFYQAGWYICKGRKGRVGIYWAAAEIGTPPPTHGWSPYAGPNAQTGLKPAPTVGRRTAPIQRKAEPQGSTLANEVDEGLDRKRQRRDGQSSASSKSRGAVGECVVCLDVTATHIVVPCGHQALCATCSKRYGPASQQRKCPYCRADVERVIEVFVPGGGIVAAPSGLAGLDSSEPADIRTLTEMGFDKEDIRVALQSAGGNVQIAAIMLCSGRS